MDIEKIEIKPNQYVWVDKDAEIKEGYTIDDKNNIVKVDKKFIFNCDHEFKIYWYKIIAASPELNLKGVPTYIEWLALKDFKNVDDGFTSFTDRTAGFISGYQTAIEELPTWNDVKKAIEMARSYDLKNVLSYNNSEEIINQLKQQK